MKKITCLVLASLILFWFGVIWQFFGIVGFSLEYDQEGSYQGYTFDRILSGGLLTLPIFIHDLFAHVAHIAAGFWLSKGKQKGVIGGIAIGFYEILIFMLPPFNYVLFDPFGISLRILFVVVIVLIIIGRKERLILESKNWRPWKNFEKL